MLKIFHHFSCHFDQYFNPFHHLVVSRCSMKCSRFLVVFSLYFFHHLIFYKLISNNQWSCRVYCFYVILMPLEKRWRLDATVRSPARWTRRLGSSLETAFSQCKRKAAYIIDQLRARCCAGTSCTGFHLLLCT